MGLGPDEARRCVTGSLGYRSAEADTASCSLRSAMIVASPTPLKISPARVRRLIVRGRYNGVGLNGLRLSQSMTFVRSVWAAAIKDYSFTEITGLAGRSNAAVR